MRTLSFICTSLICMSLIGCASSLTTSSQTIGRVSSKLTKINAIYIDDLDNGKAKVSGIGDNATKFTAETRKDFAIEVLNATPSEFKINGIEAKITHYKLKNTKEIHAADIAKNFPNSKPATLLVISLTRISSQCTNRCFYDLSLSTKLIDIDSGKPIWSSNTQIQTKLHDRLKYISTPENAKKFVKTIVEKMKADGFF